MPEDEKFYDSLGYVLYDKRAAQPWFEQGIAQVLSEKGITPVMPHVGEFATSMEMAGLSVTVGLRFVVAVHVDLMPVRHELRQVVAGGVVTEVGR